MGGRCTWSGFLTGGLAIFGGFWDEARAGGVGERGCVRFGWVGPELPLASVPQGWFASACLGGWGRGASRGNEGVGGRLSKVREGAFRGRAVGWGERSKMRSGGGWLR